MDVTKLQEGSLMMYEGDDWFFAVVIKKMSGLRWKLYWSNGNQTVKSGDYLKYWGQLIEL